MARLLSHIASIMRGSVGGITYFAGPFHQIQARQRTSPVNPMTTYQSMIRTKFADATGLWEGLDDADRILWNEYSQSCIHEGPLGTYTIPGRQTFLGTIGTRNYLTDRGVPFVLPTTDPPATPGFLSLSVGPVTPPATGIGFKVSVVNSSPENAIVYAYRSFAFSQTRNRYKGPWITAALKYVSVPGSGGGFITWTDLVLNYAYFTVIRAISVGGPHRISTQHIIRAVASAAP